MGNNLARVILRIPTNDYQRIWRHLVGDGLPAESAGFLFVKHRLQGDEEWFEHLEWYPVPDDGYLARTGHHFELTDHTRAQVIKRAHDLEASIVEFHSHGGPWPAAFSSSDQLGFREFVPHIWWRLKERPYLAVVVTRYDFDSLAWMVDPKTPQRLDCIVVDELVLKPTQLSSLSQDCYEH